MKTRFLRLFGALSLRLPGARGRVIVLPDRCVVTLAPDAPEPIGSQGAADAEPRKAGPWTI